MPGKSTYTEQVKFWVPIIMMLAQGLSVIFYIGLRTQSLQDEVAFIKRDLVKVEANQALLVQVVRDVAVLQNQHLEVVSRLDRIGRK